MKSANNHSRQTKTWHFVILFIAGLAAGFGIESFTIHHTYNNIVANDGDIIGLTNKADSLESGFIKLQELNEKYASILTDKNLDSSHLGLLDSLNILITQNETAFLKQLDSLQISNNYYNTHSSALFARIIAAYRLSIEQSNAVSTVRNSFNMGNTNYSFNQTTLNNMQSELQYKEVQVIGLTSQLYTLKNHPVDNVPVDFKTILKQQDSVLNTVLLSQKNRNKDLLGYADKMKHDNDRLNDELILLQNQNNRNNITAVSTVSKDEVNDQVNLIQADCYLSRADANQIVSNAKQRRNLLQNALEILNKLSQSSNNSTKQQAEQRLTALKKIAANNHD